MAQEYISQVSEEIEGRVTKNLSKDFSRTESRILVALSKLDEFRLNPQVRTCSVTVPGTSRNNGWENWEPTGDRTLGDSCPEAVFSACQTSHLNDSEQEKSHHRIQNFAHIYDEFPWMEERLTSSWRINEAKSFFDTRNRCF